MRHTYKKQTNQHLLNRFILLILLFILIPLLSALALSKLGDWKIYNTISFGDKILLPNVCMSEEKKQGVIYYQNSEFLKAIERFNSSLKNECRNDPESLIYKNNSEIEIGNRQSITIAVLVPISIGREPKKALEMLRGFAKAQDDINKTNEINSLPLKIAIIDDADNPIKAQKIAQTISKNNFFLGAIGHWTSDVSLAAASVYNFQKMPFITSISTTNKLSENDKDYTHQINITNFNGAIALAEYAKSQGKKKIAIFYTSRATYSKEIRKKFNDEFGGGSNTEVVAEFDFTNRFEYKPKTNVQEAIDKMADVILIVPDINLDTKAYEVMKAIKEKNSDILILGDLANLYSKSTLNEKNADGLVMALSWNQHINDISKNFFDDSRKLWKADVNYATAMSYDAVKAFSQAIANLKRLEISRENVNKELNKDNFTFQGSTGAREVINKKIAFVMVKNGEFVYLYSKQIN
ncbi:hydrophobic amino acid uptake ABC-transporter (plasmid) [Stanieria sp. NIES-3757]|nr:hydrophobic amino acid uptake ABC-transporter [Stanieria sp. NIES-3757]